MLSFESKRLSASISTPGNSATRQLGNFAILELPERGLMPDDISPGLRGDKFPITRLSAIVAAGSEDQAERARAFDLLVAAYWMPVYKYIRIKFGKSSEDAKDLTQGFFVAAIEKNFFHHYDPARARFRTFLRTCLDGFVSNEEKAARRIKRGGNAVILSLDFDSAEDQLALGETPAPNATDDYFEAEWVRSVLGLAVDALRSELLAGGKEIYFRLFDRYVLEDPDSPPSYKDLAREFDLSVSNVTNYLASARREFRRIVLERLRELTATDEEFRREARTLLGVDPQ
ncbi:MAG TPA: sigma-70 family RNA polymerase sigma factor [Blastocatellia bacterium]|nr:sigma-70 family RNA polymerase sigma factor [Blastocatellia bacterium]